MWVVVVVVVMIMVVIMIPVRRYGAPVGGCITAVDGLGQLIEVFLVLLTQRVVLALQPAAIGSLGDQFLLLCVSLALFLVVDPLLRLRLHLLPVSVDTLLVETLEVMRIGVTLREGLLAQVEILVDDFAVAGLMDQLAFATATGTVGIFELPTLGAFIDVLRTRSLRRRQ